MTTASLTDVACPFCGLACDDLNLEVSGGTLLAQGGACPRAQHAFQKISAVGANAAQSWVAGNPVPSDQAIKKSIELIASSKAPLFGGLATDVLGMRGLLELADRTGALLDHMNAEGKLRNIRTVQDAGWITTTLSEVRNRADVIVCFGTDVSSRFPRFFERCVWVDEPMFLHPDTPRHITMIGEPKDLGAATSPQGQAPEVIEIAQDRLAEAAALLRGLVAGSLPHSLKTDLPIEALKGVAQRLKAAHYGVMVWSAADLDWSHADLTVQALTATIATLNTTTRCAGMPLGGSDGDFSTDAVMLWQTGYPFRTSLASGTGRYDPVMNSTQRVIYEDEVDLVLWVAGLDPDQTQVPHTRSVSGKDCPMIVLSSAGAPMIAEAAVQITVATPGIDTQGYLFRADKVVTMPLRKAVERPYPTVAEFARLVMEGLGEQTC
jgi:formylmethanofuran dehydrogenase subunit B